MFGEARDLSGGGTMEAQAAAEAVGLKRYRAEEFGEATGAKTAVKVHLPEALLGVDIALCKKEVIFILGINMRDAIGIGNNLDLFMQPANMQYATFLRERTASK